MPPRYRRLLSFALALLAAPAIAQSILPAAVPPPSIAAKAYLLVDLVSGQTLAADNADLPREPASLTKLMTAYLAFRATQGQGAHAFADGQRIREGLARRGLAHVHRAEKGGECRRAAAWRDRAIGQRCKHRAGRNRRRVGGCVRRADESRGGAARHEEHPLRQRDRSAGAEGNVDGKRSCAPRRRTYPRFSRVLPAVFDQGVPLQQYYAAESQPAAVDRSVRRRDEDRQHRGRRLSA